jgi:hypothetical protein
MSAAREPWLREELPPPGVPIMVSGAEQRYLFWLTRTQWQDRGHVVEIGPWLGGSTLCLARGMAAARPAARHKLHAFDNFTWRAFMARFAPLPLADGESFERYFAANVAEHGTRIERHVLSLPDEEIPGDGEAKGVRGAAPSAPAAQSFAWPAAEPIEILFVDGAKSWRGMRWLLACCAPSLAAESTLLVCQDFKHWGSSWVPLLIARLRAELELVHVVRRGSTATFRLRKPIARAFFEGLPDDVARLDVAASLSELDAMADWIAETGDALGAAHVRLGAVQFLCHRGEERAALARFEDVQAAWPLRGSKGQLEDARRYLVARGLVPAPLRVWPRLLRALS